MAKERLSSIQINAPIAPPPYEHAINQLNEVAGPIETGTYVRKNSSEKNRNSIGGLMSDVIGASVHKIKESGKYLSSKEHKYLETGNVVQLISKKSGHSLQILQTPQGHLLLDGSGKEGPSAFNSLFTVYKDPSSRITLHNHFNYLAIMNGVLTLLQGAQTGPIEQCFFNVREVIGTNGNYITLESAKEPGRYVAVTSTGKIKSPITTSYADPETHFALRLLFRATATEIKSNKKK